MVEHLFRLVLMILFLTRLTHADWSTFEPVSELHDGTASWSAINADDTICVFVGEYDSHGSDTEMFSIIYKNNVWSEPTPLPIFSGETAICAGPDGRFHAILFDNQFYYIVTDEDGNWSEPEPLSWAATSDPSITVTTEGTIIASGIVGMGFNLVIKIQNDGNGWVNPEYVGTEGDREEFTDLSSGLWGDAHLFWSADSTKPQIGGRIGHCHIHPDGSWDRYYYRNSTGLADVYAEVDHFDRVRIGYTKRIDEIETAYTAMIAVPGGSMTDEVCLSTNWTWPISSERALRVAVDPFDDLQTSWNRYYLLGEPGKTHCCVQYRELRFMADTVETELCQGDRFFPENILSDSHGNLHLFTNEWHFDKQQQSFHAMKTRDRPGTCLRLHPNTYHGNEPFDLHLELQNHTGSPFQADFYCCLEAYGRYYWYPGWTEEVSFQARVIPSNGVPEQSFLTFTVPDGLGELGPFTLYAAMVNPETGELIGDYSAVMFRFR